jgi:hypothetical protein
LLEGDPGCGKSKFSQILATIVSRGDRFPFGNQNGTIPRPRRVLIVSAEDSLERSIKPWIDRHEGVTSMITCVLGLEIKDPETGDYKEFPFTLDHVEELQQTVALEKPKLVIIDPIQAYIGKRDANKANEVRPIMQALQLMATKYNLCILAIRHWTKGSSPKAIYRGSGSIDWTAAARSVINLGWHPENKPHRVVAHVKSQYAMAGKSLEFKIEDGKFYWIGETDVSADSLAGEIPTEADMGMLTATKDYLIERLHEENGAVENNRLFRDVTNAIGCSRATYFRARQSLGMISGRVGMKEYSYFKDSPEILERLKNI